MIQPESVNFVKDIPSIEDFCRTDNSIKQIGRQYKDARPFLQCICGENTSGG